MKRLAAVALLVTVVSGCSSPNTAPSVATSRPLTATTLPASGTSSTHVSSNTSSSLGATIGDSTITTATGTNAGESLGRKMGAEIAFYAIAEAAGMNDSAKMDKLAQGICSRIESGKPATVGPWMKNTYQLKGDIAAKVAVGAILFECPQYKSLLGS